MQKLKLKKEQWKDGPKFIPSEAKTAGLADLFVLLHTVLTTVTKFNTSAVVARKLIKMNKCANLHLVRHVFIHMRCIITSCLQSSSVLEKIKAVGSLPHLNFIKATSKKS